MKPTTNPAFQAGSRHLAALIITPILWGTAFPCIRDLLPALTPMNLAFWRFAVASVVLVIAAVCIRIRLPEKRDFLRLAGMALTGVFVYHSLLNLGMSTVPSATASFIMSGVPLGVVVLAWLLGLETPRLWTFLTVFIGIAGVFILAFFNGHLVFSLNSLFVCGSLFSQSIYIILQKPLSVRYSGFELVCYSFWLGTFFLLPFAAAHASEITHLPVRSLLALLYLGIVPTATGYVCWSIGLQGYHASVASSVLFLVPVTSLIVAWIWLGEVPGPMTYIGGALILSSVALNLFSKR